MTKVITLITCGVIALFASLQTTRAQYSGEAFDLKKASDLYDERGYGQSSSITVDGSLTVSNSTGVPSYVYPISNHTISGYPIDVSLTYAGSVSFTAFTEFFVGSEFGVSDPAYFRWKKFQQNRPAWILGVNGFAIQVLHNSLSFYCNPEVQEDFQDESKDYFTDEDFVWLVDGYSFSNRMLNFASGGTNSDFGEENSYIDVIKLLRSDGSILELINANEFNSQINQVGSPNLYTGYYAVNQANTQGFAIVEFDDENWPDHVQAAAGLDPTSDNSSFYHLRPRKVRYFPGDGMEYIFHEWLMPYGEDSYNGNWGTNGQRYGEPGSTPTIFYLEEIRSVAGHLTSFTRSRHYSPEKMEEIYGPIATGYEDRTRGRALTTSFDGHEIEYLDNGMIINALGRTTKVEFHQVMVDGSDGRDDQYLLSDQGNSDPSDDQYIGNTHLFDYGVLFPKAGGAARGVPQTFADRLNTSSGKEDPKYRSYVGLVTRIIDPVGRVTKFDYDPIEREYFEFNFPRANGEPDGIDPKILLTNWRLTGVTEPTARYDICYRYFGNGSPETNFHSCTESPLTTLSVVHPTYSTEFNFYNLNDVVYNYTKSFCGETLSKVEYDINFAKDQEGGQYTSSSKVSMYDYENNLPISLHETSTTFYRSPYLPKSVPGSPKVRHTGVESTQESFKEILGLNGQGYPIIGNEILYKKTTTDYPTNPQAPYVVLPTDQRVEVNGKVKSRKHYNYDLGTTPLRKYYDGDGNPLTDRDETFGYVLQEKEEILQEETAPSSGVFEDVLIKRTTLLNIPYDETVLSSRPYGQLNKFATLQNYFNLYPDNKDTDPEWEEVMYDPSVAVYAGSEVPKPVPPQWGITEEEALLVPQTGAPNNERYLSGKKYFYGTPGETLPGGLIEGKPELIGKLIKEQQVSEDETDVITLAEYEYERTVGLEGRLLPLRVTNANGAVSEMTYQVTDQDPGTPLVFEWPRLAVLHNNDEATVKDFLPPLFFSLQFEKPVELKNSVRKMIPDPLNSNTAIPGETTLQTFNHATYYGQTEGTVDANGWYSRFDYDENGRIRRVTLPGDFRALGASPYNGTEEIPLVGHSWRSKKEQTLTCTGSVASYSEPLAETNDIAAYRGITAYWRTYPKRPESDCPCISSTSKDEKEDQLPSIQETCNKTITYTREELADGTLSYTLVNDNPNTPENETSPVLLAQTLSDAKLRLVIADIEGECGMLRITCPELDLDIKRTFGSCIAIRDNSGQGNVIGTKDDGKGAASIQGSGQAGCESETEVYEETKGMVFDIPLSTSKLLSAAANTTLTFKFEALTPNTGISFVQYSEDSRPRLVLSGTFSDTKKDDADYTMMAEYDDKHLESTFTSKIDDFLHTGNTYIPDPMDPTAFNAAAPDAFQEAYRRTSAKTRFGADYRIKESEALLKEWDNTPVATPPIVSYEYTGGGLTLSVTDPLGNITSSEYDAAGRATTTKLPGVDVYVDVSPIDGVDDNPGLKEQGIVESHALVDNDLTNTPSGVGEYDPNAFGTVDVSDQDFYEDYKDVSVSVDENGVRTVTVSDAYGNVRKQLFNQAGPAESPYQVKFEYDVQNRLIKATNAEHQVTEYTYDKFGRVLYKSQADMGVTSFAYDKMGNPRFTQTQEQADDLKLTFYEYDDLNRVTVVGVAQFLPDHLPQEGIESDPDGKSASLSSGGLGRLTDLLEDEGHFLHIPGYNGQTTDQLAYNPTLWAPVSPLASGLIPPVVSATYNVETACALQNGLSENDVPPSPPYLFSNSVVNYNPQPAPSATLSDFEDLTLYPNHLRMAIQYDELPVVDPTATGSVWSTFPVHTKWNRLLPMRPDWLDVDNNPNTTMTRSVQNLKGREAAVAYREHNGEPYHYTVMSYDPRGRVEAVLHYTENIGFDGVYYEYNSMNYITKVTTIDAFRQHTTWYGYDNNGRLDSVWTVLSDVGTGYAGTVAANYPFVNSPKYPNYIESHPSLNGGKPDVVYIYDGAGRVETKKLQPGAGPGRVQATVNYAYNDRGWLTDMDATDGGGNLFDMGLEYDQTGQIRKQSSQLGSNPANTDHYKYDPIRQLKQWIRNLGTPGETKETYLYDLIGNRENKSRVGAVAGATGMSYDKDGCSYNPADPNYCGNVNTPNQLRQAQVVDGLGLLQKTIDYTYDANGGIITRLTTDPPPIGGGPLTAVRETFGNSYRSLLWSYTNAQEVNGAVTYFDDWRYRYNPRGEREQKRLYNSTDGDNVKSYDWVYYALDGRSRQLSVWHGQQTSDPVHCPGAIQPTPGTSWRYMYASEYLTYGLGATADVVTAQDGTANGTKEFKITDHLGSSRIALKEGGTRTEHDYEPYGAPVTGDPPRKGFIDKEVDRESNLGDFGVRKYDSDIGRFMSPDPLWEKYRAWTPYQYGVNSPIGISDPSGKSGVAQIEKDEDGNETGTVIVHMAFFFYGETVEGYTADELAKAVEAQWDGANATVEINGKTYNVDFNFTGTYLEDNEVLQETMKGNIYAINNFVRITKDKLNARTGEISSTISTTTAEGGNSGIWYIGQGIVENKTGAHEVAHMLGQAHWTNAPKKGDVADIRYTASALGGKGFNRVVTPDVVQSIFTGLSFNANGVAAFGETNNYYVPSTAEERIEARDSQ